MDAGVDASGPKWSEDADEAAGGPWGTKRASAAFSPTDPLSQPVEALVISRRAMTLVELLIAMAMIVVLMSLLMPALRQARRASMVMTCGSHQRQILLAMSLYATDNADFLPYTYASSGGAPPTYAESVTNNWFDRLGGANSTSGPRGSTYLTYDANRFSGTLWTCPLVIDDAIGPPWYFPGRWSVHYGMNSYIQAIRNDPYPGSFSPSPKRISSFRANPVILADGSLTGPYTGSGVQNVYYFGTKLNELWQQPAGTWGYDAAWPIDRNRGLALRLHNGLVTAAYLDGHVENAPRLTYSMLNPQ